MAGEIVEYASLRDEIKERIRRAQTKAVLSANREMLALYWDVGRLIEMRQEIEGWGSGVIPRLSRDLRNELPEIKGFSERNLKRMIRFYREYPRLMAFVPQPVALLEPGCGVEEVPQPVAQMAPDAGPMPLAETVLSLPWGHNFILIEKVKDLRGRWWYMQQTLAAGPQGRRRRRRSGHRGALNSGGLHGTGRLEPCGPSLPTPRPISSSSEFSRPKRISTSWSSC